MTISLLPRGMRRGAFRMIGATAAAFAMITQAAATPNTLFYAGTPSDPERLKGVSLDTSVLDAKLAPYSASTTPASDFANALFDELRNLELQLETDLKRELEAIPDMIIVRSVGVDINPVNITVSQDNQYISGGLKGLGAEADLKYDAPGILGSLCGNISARIGFKNISLASQYNLYTGQLSNSVVDYDISALSISCSNFFADAFVRFLDIFFPKKQFVDSELRDKLEGFLETAEMDTYFSIETFLDDLRPYAQAAEDAYNQVPTIINIDTTDINADLPPAFRLPNPLQVRKPSTGQDISDTVNGWITAVDQAVSSFDGIDAQLDIYVEYGSTNKIGFVASKKAGAHLDEASALVNSTMITYSVPDNTKSIEFFYDAGFSWVSLGKADKGPFNHFPGWFQFNGVLQDQSKVVAIIESTTIDGLNSKSSNVVHVQGWGNNCLGDDPCPLFPELPGGME